MPLKRLEKTRASLPSGYQYGDAAATFTIPGCVDRKTGIRVRFVKQFDIPATEAVNKLRKYHELSR